MAELTLPYHTRADFRATAVEGGKVDAATTQATVAVTAATAHV